MSAGTISKPGTLVGLEHALNAWVGRRQCGPLEAWLVRGLDPEGVPLRLPVPDWIGCLERIADARRSGRVPWPGRYDRRVEELLRGVLRFMRPDGAPVFTTGPAPSDRGLLLREWAERAKDPGLATVVEWWFPRRKRGRSHAPPPLPAWSRGDRPLAMLRADWAADGDFVALDHRAHGPSCALELFGLGRTWLGPSWTLGGAETATPARPTCWVSDSSADLAEWTFRAGEARVVRTAALLRGKRLALLADQVEGGPSQAELRLGLPGKVKVEPIPESRGASLVRQGRARVFPLALPRRPEGTERGSFAHEGNELVLRQPSTARRTWLPLVVSWDPERNRRPVHWRPLTVSEKSRPCPPEAAFAARLSWGRDETLVVYRSLGRPALRVFLGHQTRARFVIGWFTGAGKVEPILQVDE